MAVTPEIAVTQVVRVDHDDVRRRGREERGGEANGREQAEQSFHGRESRRGGLELNRSGHAAQSLRLEANLAPGIFLGPQVVVACGGAVPHLQTCSDRACDAQAACGTDPVIAKRFTYTLSAHLDRSLFTSGGVQIQDGGGATQMGLSINVGSPGGSFDVAAGFSEGLIPGAQFADFDEKGALALTPHWSDFGAGSISGQVCPDGVCGTQIIANCDLTPLGDTLSYLTAAQPGTYSGTCGTVPVNLTINPPFATVGACISGLKAQRCGGLKGQAKAAYNHAQIGVCDATFNVPSSHNPS
jgi:hypothetical protein